MRLVWRKTEQAAAESQRVDDRLECVSRKFLRHQPDDGSRLAELRNVVMPVDENGAVRRVDNAADDVDQRGFASAVGAEQTEDLTLVNFEVDRLQRLEPAGVGLGETLNGNDGVHAPYDTTRRRKRGNRRMLGRSTRHCSCVTVRFAITMLPSARR